MVRDFRAAAPNITNAIQLPSRAADECDSPKYDESPRHRAAQPKRRAHVVVRISCRVENSRLYLHWRFVGVIDVERVGYLIAKQIYRASRKSYHGCA